MSATDRMSARQGMEHDTRKDSESDPLCPEALRRRYDRLRSQRSAWEALWQDCYDYSLPARRPNHAPGTSNLGSSNAGRVAERLFDATAADAAEQLAATLLAQLTPPWSRWFAFQPGRDVPEEQRGAMASELDRAAELLQAQFDRSNLAVGWIAIPTAASYWLSMAATAVTPRRCRSRLMHWPVSCRTTPLAPRITMRSTARRPGPGAARPAR
jgi:hypothetical protein